MSVITTVPANLQTNVGIMTSGDIPGFSGLVTFPHAVNLGGFTIIGTSLITGLSFPNLTGVDPSDVQDSGFFVLNNSGLTSFSAPLITRIGGATAIQSNAAFATVNMPLLQHTGLDLVVLNDSTSFTSAAFPALTFCGGDFVIGGAHFVYNSLVAPLLAQAGEVELSGSGTFSLPSLTTISAGFGGGSGNIISSGNFTGTTISLPALALVGGSVLFNCPNLVSIDMSSFIPYAGQLISTFGSNSVNATSNNLILRRCVLNAAFTSGNVILAGAAPTGQGLTDKATLIGRGVSVSTN